MSARPGRPSSIRALAAGVLALTAAPPMGAHHSILPFDGTQATTVHGVVARFVWQNPHAHIYLDVTNEQGDVEQWAIESEGANGLRRLGWTKDVIRPGDRVTSMGARAKNGAVSSMGRCNAEMITRRRGHGTRSSSTDINSREDRGLDAVEAWGVAQ